MSEALERVIAEQQKRIDSLEKQLKATDLNIRDRHMKGEIFATAVVNYQSNAYNALRWMIGTSETEEKWLAANQRLRQEMKDFGFCVDCGCLDYCQCGQCDY
jgi:hypothetical protein